VRDVNVTSVFGCPTRTGETRCSERVNFGQLPDGLNTHTEALNRLEFHTSLATGVHA